MCALRVKLPRARCVCAKYTAAFRVNGGNANMGGDLQTRPQQRNLLFSMHANTICCGHPPARQFLHAHDVLAYATTGGFREPKKRRG